MSLSPGDSSAPLLLKVNYRCTNKVAKQQVLDALRTSASHQLKNWPGTLTYCFSSEDGSLDFTLIELYENEQVFWQHSQEDSVNKALSVMFDPAVRDSAATNGFVIGDPTEGVRAVLQGMMKATIPTEVFGKRCLWTGSAPHAVQSPLILVVTVDLTSSPATRIKLVNLMRAWLDRACSMPSRLLTAAGYIAGPTTFDAIVTGDAACVLALITAREEGDIALPNDGVAFRVFGAASDSWKQQFSATGRVAAFGECSAGYVVHALALKSNTRATDGDANGVAAPLPPASALFSVAVNEFTKKAEKIVFSPNAPGRSPHLANSAAKAATSAGDATLQVPLLHVLRKLCARGGLDVEWPLDLVFSQLEASVAHVRLLRDDDRVVHSACDGWSAILR
jgi:quinol monooxygenase YgiN